MKNLLHHKTEIAQIFETYCCNICVKHMQHRDQNACNIRLEQMKHFEQTSETLPTFLWNTCNICNMCNISDLLLQQPYEIITTYIRNVWNTWNIHLQHTLSSQHLLVEFAHRNGNGFDSGHDLLVGNGGISSTSAAPQQHLAARGGRGTVRSSGGVVRSELERGEWNGLKALMLNECPYMYIIFIAWPINSC